MKFSKVGWDGKPVIFWNDKVQIFDTEDMVDDICTPDAYDYSGAVETVDGRVRKLQKLVADLIENSMTAQQAADFFTGLCADTVLSEKDT